MVIMQEAKNNQSKREHPKVILKWKAPEFINHERGPLWFLIAGIITFIFISYAILTNSITMAIVFIVLSGVYYLTHNQEPRIIDIQITELGLYIDKKFYSYHMIRSFWIIYNPPFIQTLNLNLGKKGMGKISIQLDRQDPAKIRRILNNEIPEIEGQEESILDILIRLLRL